MLGRLVWSHFLLDLRAKSGLAAKHGSSETERDTLGHRIGHMLHDRHGLSATLSTIILDTPILEHCLRQVFAGPRASSLLWTD